MPHIITLDPDSPASHDELASVSAALAAENPHIDKRDIESLVSDTYQGLASSATVMTHLIPLTLNLSRRALTAG